MGVALLTPAWITRDRVMAGGLQFLPDISRRSQTTPFTPAVGRSLGSLARRLDDVGQRVAFGVRLGVAAAEAGGAPGEGERAPADVRGDQHAGQRPFRPVRGQRLDV